MKKPIIRSDISMKKIIFGSTLFIGGLLGALIFPITASIGELDLYNLLGDLSSGGITIIVMMFILISLVGIGICINETYLR